MSLSYIDLTTAIGRLLSDLELREAFGQAPHQVAQQIGVSPDDLDVLVRIDFAGISRQADAIVDKRWHEVSKLVPASVIKLGAGGRELFQYYARDCWPEGHRRHALDALGFLRFLEQNQLGSASGSDLRRVRRMASGS